MDENKLQQVWDRQEIEQLMYRHARSLDQVFRPPPEGVGPGADQHDIQRLDGIFNFIQPGLHVGCRYALAVRLVAEVQLHAVLQAPLQRDLVDGQGIFSAV